MRGDSSPARHKVNQADYVRAQCWLALAVAVRHQAIPLLMRLADTGNERIAVDRWPEQRLWMNLYGQEQWNRIRSGMAAARFLHGRLVR